VENYRKKTAAQFGHGRIKDSYVYYMSPEVEFIVGFSLFVGIIVFGFCLWWEWRHNRLQCCPYQGNSMRLVQYAPMHWPQPQWQHQQNAQQWQHYNPQQGNYAHGQGQNNESHSNGHLPLPAQMPPIVVKHTHEFSMPPKVENPRPAPIVYQEPPHPNVFRIGPPNPHPEPLIYSSRASNPNPQPTYSQHGGLPLVPYNPPVTHPPTTTSYVTPFQNVPRPNNWAAPTPPPTWQRVAKEL
jgi:hypothetical protein